jgi:hypothetical protein
MPIKSFGFLETWLFLILIYLVDMMLTLYSHRSIINNTLMDRISSKQLKKAPPCCFRAFVDIRYDLYPPSPANFLALITHQDAYSNQSASIIQHICAFSSSINSAHGINRDTSFCAIALSLRLIRVRGTLSPSLLERIYLLFSAHAVACSQRLPRLLRRSGAPCVSTYQQRLRPFWNIQFAASDVVIHFSRRQPE